MHLCVKETNEPRRPPILTLWLRCARRGGVVEQHQHHVAPPRANRAVEVHGGGEGCLVSGEQQPVEVWDDERGSERLGYGARGVGFGSSSAEKCMRSGGWGAVVSRAVA